MAIRKLFNFKGVIITSIVLLALIAAFTLINKKSSPKSDTGTHLQNTNTSNTPPQSQNAESDSETSRAAATKENSGSSGTDQANGANNSAQPISISILNAYQQSSGNLVVQTEIKGAGSGTCRLIIQKGTNSITKTAAVLFQPSFSTCEGFIIPASEFSESGTWNLQLSLEIQSVQKAVTTKSITINKK
jgi:hypothetical protein